LDFSILTVYSELELSVSGNLLTLVSKRCSLAGIGKKEMQEEVARMMATGWLSPILAMEIIVLKTEELIIESVFELSM